MTALTKEEVINALSVALEKQSGQAVSIEQSGSWYKIDGGKSVRFSELETKLAELEANEASAPVAPKAVASKPAKKAAPKTSAKIVTTAPASSNGGQTPKELWRAKLANKGKNTLPRGFFNRKSTT